MDQHNEQHLQHEDYYHATSEDILHRSGYGIHLLVWFTLVSLTGVTVAVAGVQVENLFDFFHQPFIKGVMIGEIMVVVTALTIASIKAFLVMWYFMHIKYEPFFLRMFLVICFITFMIFIVLTFFDVGFRG